jgi:hypothetical protein
MSATVRMAKANASSMPGLGSMRPVPPRGVYMGDPGFFGDLWGGIKGAATGLITGGPLGAIGGALSGSGIIKPPTPSLPPLINPRMPTTVSRDPFQSAPTGVRIGGLLPGGSKPYVGYDYGAANGAPPKGMRLNKSSYFLKDGTYVPAGTKYVKIRRRNPLNPKALDRAMGRITSAKRASKKLGRVTIRKAASCR